MQAHSEQCSQSADTVPERDADALSTIYGEDPTDILFVGENIDYEEEIRQANIYAESFVNFQKRPGVFL